MKYLFVLLSCIISTVDYAQITEENFENSTSNVWIGENSSDSLWQIGQPNKNVFDSAYSVPKAIVTDTINPYSQNEFAQIYIDFQLGGSFPSIGFYHRFKTDSINAGGYIEVSFDGGDDWHLLYQDYQLYMPGEDSIFYDAQDSWFYLYGIELAGYWPLVNDTLSNGIQGFTGNSNDWVYSEVIFPCFAVKTQGEYQLRFTFYSNNIAIPDDGWMLDNFVLDNSGICAEIEEYASVISKLYPNPTHNHFTVELNSTKPKVIVEIYNLLGRKQYSKQFNNSNSIEITPNIPPGCYQMILKENNQLIGTKKLIIE